MINRLSINNSPLDRWFKYNENTSVSNQNKYLEKEPPNQIVLSHWIVYGIAPTKEDEAFWLNKLGDVSFYDYLHGMYQLLLPSTKSVWKNFYKIIGVSGPNSARRLESPTLAVIRVYLDNDFVEPEPEVVLKYLSALIRRPTTIESLIFHVKKRMQIEKYDHIIKSFVKSDLNRPIPVEIIQAEIIALRSIAKPVDEHDGLLFISRMLSPIPAAREPEHRSVDINELKSEKDEYDEELDRANIDLTIVRRSIAQLISGHNLFLDEEQIEHVTQIILNSIPEYSFETFLIVIYKIFLDRKPDDSGYKNYLDAMKAGIATDADIVYQFINSQEFKIKNGV